MRIEIPAEKEMAQTIVALRAENERLKGVINADDERLRTAEIRVFGDSTWGCDAAAALADKALELRNTVSIFHCENERLRSALKAIAYACDGPGGNCGEFQCMIKIARAALEVKP